jgi:predicted nuclease of predicted toxin-antitoxin system
MCGWVIALGHEAIHVSAILPPDASDDLIWSVAGERNLVIVSKDQDFQQRVLASASGPALVWVRLGNQPNLALQAALEPIWLNISRLLESGERLIEIS